VANQALQLSTDRLAFQSPGSGQEFAATINLAELQIFTAAQFLPLCLCSRSTTIHAQIAHAFPVGIRAS
jgi:hypothetical protein